jgi:hypothetical protein
MAKKEYGKLQSLLPGAAYTAHLIPGSGMSLVICADLILRSNWGRHPLAAPEFSSVENGKAKKRYSNNLSLIVSDKNWKEKTNVSEGIPYKAFKDWMEFLVDYTDAIAFRGAEVKFTSESAALIQKYRLAELF